jgi:Antitoxin VbhA
MRPTEVVTVTDARSMLPQLLSHLHDGGPDAEPVFIGAHRKAAGVLISVELFEELTALREKFARRESVASAWGSVTAEGLVPTGGFTQDADEFAEGSIDADELARRAIKRHDRRK